MDTVQDGPDVVEYFDVVDAMDNETQRKEVSFTPLIMDYFYISSMGGSVDFDDEASFTAQKVNDIWPDGHLSAELVSVKATISERAPKLSFCFGQRMAQPLGSRISEWRGMVHDH